MLEPGSRRTAFLVGLFKVVGLPLKAVAILVGVPLHLLATWLGRARCPGCGRKSLYSMMAFRHGTRERYFSGACRRCGTSFELVGGRWVRSGPAGDG